MSMAVGVVGGCQEAPPLITSSYLISTCRPEGCSSEPSFGYVFLHSKGEVQPPLTIHLVFLSDESLEL